LRDSRNKVQAGQLFSGAASAGVIVRGNPTTIQRNDLLINVFDFFHRNVHSNKHSLAAAR